MQSRHGSAGVYRWEFDKGKKSLAVAVQGPSIVDEAELLIRTAIDGAGLAFMLEERAAPHLASGALVRVLEDWRPPSPDTFCTTRVDDSSQRRSRHSSKPFVCSSGHCTSP